MSTANEIRQTFLNHFKDHGHSEVSSGPLVPDNDPTLMFANAGMNQFKGVFSGAETRPYSRATTAQKCVRAGGKHNDLDNVGYTARHGTFFEMLGNFSFGDYFKEGAIEMAWQLVNGTFQLPKERLLVTVYAEDEEAATLWKKIAGFSDDKIIRIPTSDNFWSMGDTGPCGPCSEIFYDHGDKIWGGPPGSPEEDGDRFIEFWNLVFMQYEQINADTRINLPAPCIDTGMGLERITSTLNGSHDMYSIPEIRRLIEASANLTNVDPDGEKSASHRVIADHLRSTGFLIAEGVLPSNEGRGYVLRRIMRRAMRHAHMLGATEPLMHRLVPEFVASLGDHYGELKRAEALITETMKLEETKFRETLDKGLKLLDAELGKISGTAALPGDVAFKLYDTFGFPLDLTQDVLRGQEREVDVAGFNTAMEEQRAKARAAWSGSGGTATETIWFDLKDKHGSTDFLGYERETAEGRVLAIVDKDGKEVDSAASGDTVRIVLNQTPFYGESGGQVGDTGHMSGADCKLDVTAVSKPVPGLFAHAVTVTSGTLKKGSELKLVVDSSRRAAIRGHHSATHLLHAALRETLGDHVAQKGSLVAPERLRFDISQPRAITAEEMLKIEDEVNRRVLMDSEVTTRLMPIDDAIESGAMALFGEKYDDEVRVVAMGGPQAPGEKRDWSVELCGGTHVRRTGEIGLFRVVSEGAVSSGVRRIEAVTGTAALAHMRRAEDTLADVAASLKTPPSDVPERVAALIAEKRKLEAELTETRRKLAAGGGGQGAAREEVNGTTFSGQVLEGVPPKDLKPMADALKSSLGSAVIALVAVNDGKASVVIAVTDDLTDKHSAVDLVRQASEALGGKGGGGRADMAQAGGPDGDKAFAALDAIKAAL